MPTTGDPLNLKTWTKGDKEWHIDFNDNMEDLNTNWWEIVDARGGWETLKERLESVDEEVIENNLILEVFRRMIGDLILGADPFQDGWVDTLQDESNVDLPNCQNQQYDAGGDFYKPTQNGSPNNMTLRFETYETVAIPVRSKILFILEKVSPTVTLNADLKAWATIDGFVTEHQITLEDVGEFATSQRIVVGTVEPWPQDDNITGVKITTHNNKDLKIHAVANMLQI